MCTENENIIEDHFVGDTWNGMELLLEDLEADGVTVIGPVDLTGCSIRSQFRKSAKGGVAFEFKTEDETIKIVDYVELDENDVEVSRVANCVAQYQPRDMDFDAASYIFDVEVTFPDGCIKTLLKSGWNLINDVSHA